MQPQSTWRRTSVITLMITALILSLTGFAVSADAAVSPTTATTYLSDRQFAEPPVNGWGPVESRQLEWREAAG